MDHRDASHSKMNPSSFNSTTYEDGYPSGMHNHWWNLARNQVINRTLIRHLPARCRILEIGCGTGIVTSYLENNNWEITGIDTGVPPRDSLRSKKLLLGKNAFQMPLAERLKFEAIALFDVIEHIDDDQDFLKKILSHFPNATKVILTVPARQELWSNYDIRYGHHRRYSMKRLTQTISNCELKLKYASYFFHLIYPLLTAKLRAGKAGRATRLSGPVSPLAKRINYAIAQIFYLEFRMLPSRLIGTSIIGVAERLR